MSGGNDPGRAGPVWDAEPRRAAGTVRDPGRSDSRGQRSLSGRLHRYRYRGRWRGRPLCPSYTRWPTTNRHTNDDSANRDTNGRSATDRHTNDDSADRHTNSDTANRHTHRRSPTDGSSGPRRQLRSRHHAGRQRRRWRDRRLCARRLKPTGNRAGPEPTSSARSSPRDCPQRWCRARRHRRHRRGPNLA